MLWGQKVTNMRVQASRERKYAPQINSPKETVVCDMNNVVVVKVGSKV